MENITRRVRKNAKRQIAKLCDVSKVTSYSLHSNFTGVEFEVQEDWSERVTKELYTYRGASLTVTNEKNCTLHIHSNLWYSWSI